MTTNMYQLRPIGTIHSSLTRPEDCPLQEEENAPEATIEIFAPFSGAAAHLSPGAQIVLLTWLDQADRSVLTTLPRNDPDAMQTCVFSTRSPDRPNPIGLHQTKVREVLSDTRFTVACLEVLDQTPLLDIKSGKG